MGLGAPTLHSQAWCAVKGHIGKIFSYIVLITRRGYHGGVVGAEDETGDVQGDILPGAFF